MDARGNIYESENPDPEDAARLDGYLRGRAEADALKRELEAELSQREQEVLKRLHGDGETPEAVADHFGVDPSRISHVEVQALRHVARAALRKDAE